MQYRKEVDGLRSLAIVPVILFHAGVGGFGGGYVGVDVFFVISGYLITSILAAELEQGRYSIASFYERRARRILPALFVMLVVTLPFAYMLLNPADLVYFAKSLLGSVFARQISADAGATETIMFRDGYLTEASASNVWVVHEGAVLGPPKSEHVLEGIRYDLIRELCEETGIAYNLRPIPEGEVLAADELLLSSATKEVLPVTKLDGQPVGHGALRGKPGPVYARLYEAYQRAKQTMSI